MKFEIDNGSVARATERSEAVPGCLEICISPCEDAEMSRVLSNRRDTTWRVLR